MKTIRLLLFIIGLAWGSTSLAQVSLPPVFKGEEGRMRPDEITRVYLVPQKVLWKTPGVKYEHELLQLTNGQTELGKHHMCEMLSAKQDTASILLDFGRELHGGLRMVMGSSTRPEPSTVRIRFGESVQECFSTTNNTKPQVGYATDDHAKRDIILEVPRDGQIEIGNTGYRFVRIDLLRRDVAIRIKEIAAIFRYRDIPYIGSFHSSDARLNEIWMMGAYTVHLNMQEFLWDGVKRDRLVWVGDLHPEIATINAVFGAQDVVTRSIDFACKEFPLPRWLNNMPAYSLWYLIIHHDWWMHHADRDFLERHRAYITGLIDQVDKTVNEKGEFDGAKFLDWPSSPDKEGVDIGVRALVVWSMRCAAQLCELLGDAPKAAQCRAIGKRVSAHLPKPQSLKQAAALMDISGDMKPQYAFKHYLEQDGARGFSTFYGYYMLEAEAMAGQYRQAMDVIRTYWGGMIDMGATTFWEDFDLAWMENANRIDQLGDPAKKNIHGDYGEYCYPGFRCSLAHGWASGPTAWMSRHILGIQIEEAGCRHLRIDPHLGDLDWVEGTYPTPFGPVQVRHEKKSDGSLRSTITKPAEVKITSTGKDVTIHNW